MDEFLDLMLRQTSRHLASIQHDDAEVTSHLHEAVVALLAAADTIEKNRTAS